MLFTALNVFGCSAISSGPPPTVDELLGSVSTIVVGKVTKVVQPTAKNPFAPATLTISVSEVLKGKVVDKVVFVKAHTDTCSPFGYVKTGETWLIGLEQDGKVVRAVNRVSSKDGEGLSKEFRKALGRG